MGGVGDLALDMAPIAGGLVFGAALGYLKGPDVRKKIKEDMELLAQLPPEDVQRRTELQRSIDRRIDDLLATVNRYPRPRAGASYRGGLRDVLLLVCAILFTVVWWRVDHHKTTWLPMFVILIVISVVAAGYALGGLHRFLLSFRQRKE